MAWNSSCKEHNSLHPTYLYPPFPLHPKQRLRAAPSEAATWFPANGGSAAAQLAVELVLRPAVAGVGNDDLQGGGSEEVWEHLVLLDDASEATLARISANVHGARGVAHELEAPAAVLEWLVALEDESAKIRNDNAADELPANTQTGGATKHAAHAANGLPSFLSFASRDDTSLALAPSATALSHLGTGPDVALVMGWPSRESFAAALTPEGPLAHGLLLGLSLDDMLWDRLRQAADESSTKEDVGGAGENGVRLRVEWQRSSGKMDSSEGGLVFDVTLERAPEPTTSTTWQGAAGEWCEERARAMGSTLGPSDDAHPWQVLRPLGDATRAIRLFSAADGEGLTTTHRPLSAAEAAAEAATKVESVASFRGVRLWFSTGEHLMPPDPGPETDQSESHRRLTLGSYYRDLCAYTSSAFSTSEPPGCSSWYWDATSMWCVGYGGSCNFCSQSGVDGGNPVDYFLILKTILIC